DAFYEIVNASRAPEDAELADALDKLKWPLAVSIGQITTLVASRDFVSWLGDRRNSRKIPHRFEACGYVVVRNPAAKRDGLWRVGGKPQAVYAKRELSLRDQLAAATALTAPPSPT